MQKETYFTYLKNYFIYFIIVFYKSPNIPFLIFQPYFFNKETFQTFHISLYLVWILKIQPLDCMFLLEYCIWKIHPILFYHLKKLFYHLYYTILQHTQHPNFYFLIQHIKIIYLHNKIIYPKTISILSHLSPLSNFYLFLCLSSIETTCTTTSSIVQKGYKTQTNHPCLIAHHPPPTPPKQNP